MNWTLEELLGLSEDQLRNLPADDLFNSLKDLIFSSEDKCSVFRFIFSRAAGLLRIEDLETRVLRNALPMMEEISCACLENEGDADIEDFNAVAELMSTLLRSVSSLSKKSPEQCSIGSIISLPRCCFRILAEFYEQFPSNEPSSCDDLLLKTLGQNAVRMQTLLLMLLTANCTTTQSQSDAEYSNELLVQLCNVIGTQAKSRFNDIKTIADSWKCFSKIASTLKNSVRPDQWMNRAIEILCWQIEATLEELIQQRDSATRSADRSVKMIVFFTKISQKLLLDFGECRIEEILNKRIEKIVKKAFQLRNIDGTTRATLREAMVSFIPIGATEVPATLFAELNSVEKCEICINISTFILRGYETVSDGFLISLFENLTDIAEEIVLENDVARELYEDIVVNLVVQLIQNSGKAPVLLAMEKRLTSLIVDKQRLCRALVGLDIWNVYFRQMPSSLRVIYFEKLSSFNGVFASDEHCLPKTFIKVLLRNLFQILSESQQIIILEKLQPEDHAMIHAIGPEGIAKLDPDKSREINDFYWNKVNLALTECKARKNRESYVKLVEALEFRCDAGFTNEMKVDEQLLSHIRQLNSACDERKHPELYHTLRRFLCIFDSRYLLDKTNRHIQMGEINPTHLSESIVTQLVSIFGSREPDLHMLRLLLVMYSLRRHSKSEREIKVQSQLTKTLEDLLKKCLDKNSSSSSFRAYLSVLSDHNIDCRHVASEPQNNSCWEIRKMFDEMASHIRKLKQTISSNQKPSEYNNDIDKLIDLLENTKQ